jgi:hypothetical protein
MILFTAGCRTINLIPAAKTRFLQETWFFAVFIVMNNVVGVWQAVSGPYLAVFPFTKLLTDMD